MIPAHIEERIVRLHFVEKWPVGTIAKQVGVHHSTVKRVLRSKGVPVALTARPSMVEPFLPFIRETLEAYPKLPSSRLHEMVVERGYPGSRSHFRRLVATLRPRKPAEAYQRLSTLSGEEAQVDWASFGTRVVGRATRRVSAFVVVLSWSRMPFVRFFYDQRMGAFLEGHVRALDAFGGVPPMAAASRGRPGLASPACPTRSAGAPVGHAAGADLGPATGGRAWDVIGTGRWDETGGREGVGRGLLPATRCRGWRALRTHALGIGRERVGTRRVCVVSRLPELQGRAAELTHCSPPQVPHLNPSQSSMGPDTPSSWAGPS